VDLSDQARRALLYAAAFAAALHARLLVLRVDSAAEGTPEDRAVAVDEMTTFLHASLHPSRAGSGTEIVLRGGVPAFTILDTAAEVSAQLVVMGTHGRGTLARPVLGSTAATVLSYATVPIAVVSTRRSDTAIDPLAGSLGLGTIVVPLDLHVDSTRQLVWARQVAAESPHPLFVLHVVPAGEARGTEIDRLRTAVAGPLDGHAFQGIVREGRVVPEVIAAVRQENAGLVVMGRTADAPGAMAYELLRRTDAVVAVVP
jgi:nucleotide-binding universal stress UspA family protein